MYPADDLITRKEKSTLVVRSNQDFGQEFVMDVPFRQNIQDIINNAVAEKADRVALTFLKNLMTPFIPTSGSLKLTATVLFGIMTAVAASSCSDDCQRSFNSCIFWKTQFFDPDVLFGGEYFAINSCASVLSTCLQRC